MNDKQVATNSGKTKSAALTQNANSVGHCRNVSLTSTIQ